MSTTVLVNGEAADALAIDDRGLHYGDGLFETLAVIDGDCPWFDRHVARLRAGCDRLGIPVPDERVLLAETRQLARQHTRAVIKIIVTRGRGGRGYRTPAAVQPTRVVSRHAWPDYPAANWREGVRVFDCRTPLACHPQLAGIKHLNRLENVLARQEWNDGEFAEGLMFDLQENLIEGIMSNVFVIKNDRLITPDTRRCGVDGILRRWLIDQAQAMGLGVEVRDIPRTELASIDGMLLSNSLIGLWPVREYAGHDYPLTDIHHALSRELDSQYPVRHV